MLFSVNTHTSRGSFTDAVNNLHGISVQQKGVYLVPVDGGMVGCIEV